MARNEEKQLARLNRLLLKNQHEEERKRNPTRPHLATLHTAAEVKKWLPSIKRDLDFCLKQTEVLCYPERKIEEFNTQISYLKRDYRAFVQKLKKLTGSSVAFQEPWIDRPYSTRGHKRVFHDEDDASGSTDSSEQLQNEDDGKPPESLKPLAAKRIHLPVLEGEEEQQYSKDAEQPVIVWNYDPSQLNKELEFNFAESSKDVDLCTSTEVDRTESLVEYSSSDSDT